MGQANTKNANFILQFTLGPKAALLPYVAPTLSVRLVCLTSGWSPSIWLGEECSLKAALSSILLTSKLSPGFEKQIKHAEVSGFECDDT